MRLDIIEEIKDFIIDELNGRKGNEYYLCDIGTDLSESQNIDGSWTYNRAEAKREIVSNWDFCRDFYNYYKDNFGESPVNPFENTEQFHCQMMIFAVSNSFGYAVNQTESYSDYNNNWNEKIEITEEFISEIEEALKGLEYSDIF